MSNQHDIVLRVIGDVRSALGGLKQVREGVAETGKVTETASKQIKSAAERNVQSFAAQREKLQTLAGEYHNIARSATSSAKQQEAAAILATRATERLATVEGRATRQARERSAAIGGLTKNLLGYAGAYVGATGLLSLGEKAIANFNEERLAASRLHQEFGQGAGQVEAWSKKTASGIYLWSGASEKLVANAGQMLEVMGLVPKRAQPMAESLVTLAAKVAFLRQEDPAKVLNMFEAGLAGRGRALKTLGFWLDDTTLKARAMQLGLISASRDQTKIAVLTDRMAVDQAKYANAVAKFGQGSTQAHSSNEALVKTHEALAKAIDGVVPKLTTEQKAIAANSLLMQQGKTYVDAFARSHGSGAAQIAQFHAQVNQLEEGIGKGLLPAVKDILTPVNKWISSSKNQEKITHDVTGAVHGLETGVKTVIPIVREFYQGADKVAHFLGGWKHALELLLALKVLSTVNKWTGAIDLLMGGRKGGLLGATGAADGLLGRLSMLAKIGAVGISIPIYLNIIEQVSKQGVHGLSKTLLKYGLFPALPAAAAAEGVTNLYDSLFGGDSQKPTMNDKQWKSFTSSQMQKERNRQDAAAVTPDLGPAPSAKAVQQAIALQRRLDAVSDRIRRDAEKHHQQIPDTGGGGSNLYVGKSSKSSVKQDDARRKLIQFALSKLGDPYVWGASGPNSFDCSGLVLWAMAQEGVSLPHSTYAQVQMGKHVSLPNIQAGDVVFTNYGEGGKKGPGHEGLYIGGGKVEEAPHTGDKVKIVSLSDFIHGGKYEVRDFLGAGHGKGVGSANTLLNLKMQGLELEQAITQTLGRLSDTTKVQIKNRFGTVIGTETVGEIRKKAEELLKVVETATSPDRVREAVKGLQELGKQTKGAVGQMVAALKLSENMLKTSAGHALDLLLQVFDAKTAQMIQHAQAKVKMLDGARFTVSADQSDPNGLTPAERQLKDMQSARDESDRQQAIADARTAVSQAQTADEKKAAQKQLDDALYAETVANLQKRADAERSAADKAIQAEQQDLTVKRQLERDSFARAYDQIIARVEAGTETAGKAQGEILKLMKKYGIDASEATKLLGSSFERELVSALNKVIMALGQIVNQVRALKGLPPIKIHIQPVLDPAQDNSGLKPPGQNTGQYGGLPDPTHPYGPLPAPGSGPNPWDALGSHPFGYAAGGLVGALRFKAGGVVPPGPKGSPTDTPGNRAAAMWTNDYGIDRNDTYVATALQGMIGNPAKFRTAIRHTTIDGQEVNQAAGTWIMPGDEKFKERAMASYRGIVFEDGNPDQISWGAAASRLKGGTAELLGYIAQSRGQTGSGSKVVRMTSNAVHWDEATAYGKPVVKPPHVPYFGPGSHPEDYDPSQGKYGGFAAGGLARAPGRVPGVDRGKDTVLALLRPGELVLTPEHQARNAALLGYRGSNSAGFLMGRLAVPRYAAGGLVSGMSGAGYVSMPPSSMSGGGGETHVHFHFDQATIIGGDKRRVVRDLLDPVQSELTRLMRREISALGPT